MILEVANVFNGSGRQIVYDQHVITPGQICLGKVRSNKASAGCYEYTESLNSSVRQASVCLSLFETVTTLGRHDTGVCRTFHTPDSRRFSGADALTEIIFRFNKSA